MATESKHYCPNCGYEYESWVEACPDCNAALVSPEPPEAARPQLEADDDPHWTVVGNVPNAILGNLMKSQIEAAGIPVLMFRTRFADIAEFSHNDYVPQDLLVPEERLAEARAIMDAAQSPGRPPGYWGDPWDEEGDFEEYAGEDEGDSSTEAPLEQRRLPRGWGVLRGDSDSGSQDREASLSTREEPPPGWYWADETDGPQAEQSTEYEGRVRRIPTPYMREHTTHRASRPSNTDWYRPSRATKIVYAVLILTMGLPFIIQVLQYLASIFTR